MGLSRAGFKFWHVYLLRGVCVPDTGLGSVDTAVNKISPACLGLTSQYGRQTPRDILSVIQGIMTGFALMCEGEARGTTRTHNRVEVTSCRWPRKAFWRK